MIRIPIYLQDWHRHSPTTEPHIKAHIQLGLRTPPNSDPHVRLDIRDRVKRRCLVIDLPRLTALLLAKEIIMAYLGSHEHDA